MLDDSLLGPSTRGQLAGHDGQVVPYELRLLSDAEVEALAGERDAYLAERGIGARGPDTDTLFDDELALRICAACVRKPGSGEPLLGLAVWRRLNRVLISLVIAHYAAVMASERPDAEQLGAMYARVSALVSDTRSGAAREVEDYRVLFARPLFYFYGTAAAQLSLAQVAYHALYTGEVMPRDG